MNGVVGMSRDILESDKSLTSEQQEKLKYINHNGNLILTHFNNLLDAARIDTGKLNLNFENLDLLHDIDFFISDPFVSYIDYREIKIQKKLPQKLPILWGDKYRMRQIVMESIWHTAAFCPPEETFTFIADHIDNFVTLKIRSDHFTDVTKEDLQRLESTSLTFYICKKLVLLHNGKISTRINDVFETTISLPSKEP